MVLTVCKYNSYGQIEDKELKFVLLESLKWLEQNQEKETVGDSIFAGEWPSTMGLKNSYILLGSSFDYRDSNCFTQANIFNTLAEMYLSDSTLSDVPKMLRRATPEILSYRDSLTFNFWKKLPPNIPLSRKGPHPPGYLAHRPTNFGLKTRFINNAADIANDADDTSTGSLSLFYRAKILGDSSNIPSQKVFDSYIDGSRPNYHWYNFIHKIPRPSGAYMTWLSDEYEFKHWSFPWQVAHNLVFFLPGSSCFPHPYKRYIPWGANDVDAIVNCNVINYLGKTDQLENSAGKEGAIRLLKHVIKKERWSRAGIYYPNRYFLHYSFSKIYPFLEDSLVDEAKSLVSHLVTSQNADGSFHSRNKANRKDPLQSTVYAFLAMINFKVAGMDIPKSAIDKALNYILFEAIHDSQGIHWKGGVFFSGGTIVRNVLFFKSDAYTTAIMAQGIQKYIQEYQRD